MDAIWVTDLNSKVTFITPSCINIGGYTPEEVMAFENSLDLYDDDWDGPLYNWSGYEKVDEESAACSG